MELNPKEVAESQLQAMPLCGTADMKLPSLSAHSNDLTTGLAFIAQDRIWTNKSELQVKFLNGVPRGWTYGESRIDKSMILNWANVWHDRSEGIVPKFVQARWSDTPDIRIRLNNSQKNETLIGIEAQDIPCTEPTMWLDLSYNGYDNDVYKKHLVIHEFGHALGLLHEHQRSDFWKVLKPYIEEDKIVTANGHKAFNRDWTAEKRFSQTSTSEYDPDSIMHYWFSKDWLKEGYSSTEQVEAEYDKHNLTEEEKMYLLGVHKRSSIAKEPSNLDIEFLAKMYRSTAVDTRSAEVVTCSNCRSGCVVL